MANAKSFEVEKNRTLRIIAITLLLIVGFSAVCSGILFIVSPDGHLIGITLSTLRFAPFGDFLIPGIILLAVNGVSNLIVAFMAITKKRHYPFLVALQGVLLVGWILVQIVMLREFNGLHLLMIMFGTCLILIGILMHPEHYNPKTEL
jgi:hypothetical protein